MKKHIILLILFVSLGSVALFSQNVVVNFKDTSVQTKNLINVEFGTPEGYPSGYPYPTPSTGFNKWLIQFYVSVDNTIDPLNAQGNPTGDDMEVISVNGFKQYLSFSPTGGVVFNGCVIAPSGSQYNTWIGSKIYARIFNSNTKESATKTVCTTSLYTVTGSLVQNVNIYQTCAWSSWVLYSTQLTHIVEITSSPAGADIYANGIDSGFNTPHTFSINEGSNVIYTLEKSGYAWAPSSLIISNITTDTSQNFVGNQIVHYASITSTPDNADIYVNRIDTGYNTPHTFTLIEGSSVTYTVVKAGYTWIPSSFIINSIMTDASQNFTGQTVVSTTPVSVSFRDLTIQTKTAVNQEFRTPGGYPNGYPYPTPSTGFNKWLIQFYKSADDVINPLDLSGNPTGDDVEVIAKNGYTQYLSFSQTGGVVFNGCVIAPSGSQYNTWIGSKIYVRIFNSNTKAGATKSMSMTSLYTITGSSLQVVSILPGYSWSPWVSCSSSAMLYVDINSTPEDADIFTDGVDTGFNTPHTFTVLQGSNATYTVSKENYSWSPASLVLDDIMANTVQNFIGTQTIIPGEPIQVIPPGNVLIASVSLETPDATSFNIDCTALSIDAMAGVTPNSGLNDDNSYVILLNASTGTADLLISVPAGTWWICGYWDGSWHRAVSYPYSSSIPGTVTIYNIPFGFKGEVPVVLSEGTGLDPTLPVTLSSFTATIASQCCVNLKWVTESETQVLGYNVYRSDNSNITNSNKLNPYIIPATNSSDQQSYALTDKDGLQINQTYYYWLENVDMNGESNLHGPISATISGQTNPELPDVNSIGNAYPNPTKTGVAATIDVNIKDGDIGTVSIYNTRGQLVKKYTVHQGVNKLTWDTKDYGCGIYFYKLNAPNINITKKLVIVN